MKRMPLFFKFVWMSAAILIFLCPPVHAFEKNPEELKKEAAEVNLTRVNSKEDLPPQMKPGAQPFEQEVEKAQDPDAQGL